MRVMYCIMYACNGDTKGRCVCIYRWDTEHRCVCECSGASSLLLSQPNHRQPSQTVDSYGDMNRKSLSAILFSSQCSGSRQTDRQTEPTDKKRQEERTERTVEHTLSAFNRWSEASASVHYSRTVGEKVRRNGLERTGTAGDKRPRPQSIDWILGCVEPLTMFKKYLFKNTLFHNRERKKKSQKGTFLVSVLTSYSRSLLICFLPKHLPLPGLTGWHIGRGFQLFLIYFSGCLYFVLFLRGGGTRRMYFCFTPQTILCFLAFLVEFVSVR